MSSVAGTPQPAETSTDLSAAHLHPHPALAALTVGAIGVRSRIALVLGAAGASLFYGDAIITPALSVLSAMEGLRTIPSAAHIFNEGVVRALTIAIFERTPKARLASAASASTPPSP